MRIYPLLVFILFFTNLNSQCFFPLSLEDLNNVSDFIIEGKVISSRSIDASDSKMIYTAYTIDVIQTIKGEAQSNSIEIIRPGGIIDNRMVQVTAVLEMQVGQMGTFFLKEFNKSKLSLDATNLNTFEGTASLQSFFAYDQSDLTVSNPFLKYQNYSLDWYNTLEKLTSKSIEDKVKLEESTPLKSTATINSFSPTAIRAGTMEELTINGSGFGATRGSSVVEFRDPNTGGTTWNAATPVNYQSWSDNEIRVFVPQSNFVRSGTGQIRVILGNGMIATSTDNLTVLYAKQTLEFSFDGSDFLVDVQHFNQNTVGGMTFQYNNTFATNIPGIRAFERAINSWRCKSDINWTIGDPTAVTAIALDGTNLVTMDNSLPSGVLGRATTYFSCGILGAPTWNIEELDIVFQNIPFTGFTWNYGPGNPTSTQFDFESVSVHEIGHSHQLGHVIDNTKVMHFTTSNGLSLRNVDVDSENGALDVMNVNTSTTPSCGTIMTAHDHSVFVDHTATGLGNGDTWNNGFTLLQDAFENSSCPEKIRLATGTYYTDEGGGQTNNDRTTTFELDEEITVEGGYPSGGGTRNIAANPTILSGDIQQNNNSSTFSYNVLTIDANSTLDGIIVERGNASGSSSLNSRGGGIYINADANIIDCTIRECESTGSVGEGGGIYQESGSSLIENSVFLDNVAMMNAIPGLGGAILANAGMVILNNCTLTNNGDDAVHFRNGATINVRNTVSINN